MTEYNYSIQKTDFGKIQLKIYSDSMELNLVIPDDEVIKLVKNIEFADWNERKSIKAGTCLGANAFWSFNEDKSISMLIGQDDETWEIGMVLSMEMINELKNKAIATS